MHFLVHYGSYLSREPTKFSDPVSNNGIWANTLNIAFIQYVLHAHDAVGKKFMNSCIKDKTDW